MHSLLIDLETTVKIAALPPKSTVPTLEFPELYIVAPGLRGAIKYPLETAPAWAFDAWVQHISGIAFDYAMAARLLRINRSRWSLEEKWSMINALAVSLGKIGVKLPLFSREEALAALKAMEVQSGQ